MNNQIDELGALVHMRKNFQKMRIAQSNRLFAIAHGNAEADPSSVEVIQRWHDTLKESEELVENDIRMILKKVDKPIAKLLKQIKGIGPIAIATLITGFDVHIATTPSHFWRYAGYSVVIDPSTGLGKRESLVRGEKAHFNRKMKIAMRVIAGNMLKCRSPYTAIYYSAKEYYKANRDWTDYHIHNAALGKMIKIFLAHLWVYWRTSAGLSVRPPYAIEKLGHENEIKATDYGWPELDEVDVVKEDPPVRREKAVEPEPVTADPDEAEL